MDNDIETIALKYINFAMKSNSIVYGFDNIKDQIQRINVVICCKEISDKLYDNIVQLSQKVNIDVFKFDKHTIDELIFTSNCKVIGIKNKDLANQIGKVLKGVN